jgi:hypothetical protein
MKDSLLFYKGIVVNKKRLEKNLNSFSRYESCLQNRSFCPRGIIPLLMADLFRIHEVDRQAVQTMPALDRFCSYVCPYRRWWKPLAFRRSNFKVAAERLVIPAPEPESRDWAALDIWMPDQVRHDGPSESSLTIVDFNQPIIEFLILQTRVVK